MDGRRISQLDSGTALSGLEFVPITQNGTTVKVDSNKFKTTNASDLTSGQVDVNLIQDGNFSQKGVLQLGTTSLNACSGTDSRLSDSRVPKGDAGGDFVGEYPSPTLQQSGVTSGTYGDANNFPIISVDGKGRIVAAGLRSFTSGGTVTSVGISSSTLTVTGSPITTSGIISLNITAPVSIAIGGTGATTQVSALTSLGGIATTLLGASNGVATLGVDGLLSSSQIPQLTASQIAQITPVVIGAVATDQLGALNGVAQLSSGVLKESQVPALSTTQIAQITPTVIGAISTDQLGALNGVAQLVSGKLKSSQVPALSTEQIAQVTPAAIGAIATDQLGALNGVAQLVSGKLKASQVPALSTDQIAQVTPAAIGAAVVTRSISAGTGLTGGGDLSADRTLTISYGSTAGTAAQGNDSRLSDSRTPTLHKATHYTGGIDALTPSDIGAVPEARQINAGVGLSGGGDLGVNRSLSVLYGSTLNTSAQGNDARLSDSRTPTAHASTHASGGTDQIASLALTSGTISTAPSIANDLVNKSYADSIGSGINFHDAANYATLTALSGAYTYFNGTSGVGATITANATGTLTIDGYTLLGSDVGKRLLIKNESGAFVNNTTPSAAFNGIYTLTTAGTGSVPFVLTRATDYDTSGSGSNEIQAGDFVLVLDGSQANSAWVQQTKLPITVGTTSLVFNQFAAAVPGVTSFKTSLSGLSPSSAINGIVDLTGTLGISSGGTGSITASTALTNLGAYPAANPSGFTSNVGTVTSVSGSSTPVSGLALVGTVTSSGSIALTGTLAVVPANFASQIQKTVLAAPNAADGTPAFRALVKSDIPTLDQNTTGTAANVTGVVAILNGGTGSTSATSALTNLGAYPAINPSGFTSNTGTVTSVSGSGTVSGLSLSGTVTTSGNVTLGGTLAVVPSDFASQTQKTILAAPTAADGTPTFRALASTDLPASITSNTTGNAATATTAAGLSSTLAVGSGGTGLTAAPLNGQIDIGNGTGFTRATLTAGSNITIANAAGAITIASSGGGGSGATLNRIINGNMSIFQRNTGFTVTVPNSSTYILDRFLVIKSVTLMGLQANQSSIAPAGFSFSQLLTVSSGSAPSSLQDLGFEQRIEGFNVADLSFGSASASTVTLSFWVRSNLVGTYAVSLANRTLSRSYVQTYSISTADTWEQKSITIPGDTSGTWLVNNDVGIRVNFDLGSGSSSNTPAAGAWQGSYYKRTSGTVNWGATTGNNFYITGIQLEKGSSATTFEHRFYGTELNLCYRYYYQSWGSGAFAIAGNSYIGAVTNPITTRTYGSVTFPISMRDVPIASFYDQLGQYGKVTAVTYSSNLSAIPEKITVNGFSGALHSGSALATTNPIYGAYTASAEL